MSISTITRPAAAIAFAVLFAGVALAASPAGDDGFGAFWSSFKAAIAKNDEGKVKALTAFPFFYDGSEHHEDEFGTIYKGLFSAKTRACLAKAKPVRDMDPEGGVSYSAFCGEEIFVFSMKGRDWRFTDIGVND